MSLYLEVPRVKSPVKWAGGKSQLIPQFEPLFPGEVRAYAEPFFGGGSVFFRLQPASAVLIDNNVDLINLYLVIRDHVEDLIQSLQGHRNDPAYYYALRSLDPALLDPVARASRFLYLNKTGYNGLWRVNRKGQHNVPFGRYKNPSICDADNLRLVSAALFGKTIICGDFALVLEHSRPGLFVYFDPPYHPVSATAYFTSYTRDAFGEDDQRRLAATFRELDRRGCLVMLSNSDTPFIRDLYRGYDVKEVTARRAINCRPDRRGPVTELVIRNYS